MAAGEVPGEELAESGEAPPAGWAEDMASEFRADMIGALSQQTEATEDAIHSEHQRTALGSRSGMLARQRGLVHDGRQLQRGVDQIQADNAGAEAAFAATMARQISSGEITVPEGGPLTPEEIAHVEAHPIPGHGMAEAIRALRAERAASGAAPTAAPVPPPPPPDPASASAEPAQGGSGPQVEDSGAIGHRAAQIPYS
jgi:hypothetical protein